MRSFHPTSTIKVSLNFGEDPMPVGLLAMQDRQIYFEYDNSFIKRGLGLSPFKLPLKPGVTTFDYALFEGLAGVFNDSLPDGWGRLLLDRLLRTHGILPNQVTPLDRLAYVGSNGMGALVYEPDYSIDDFCGMVNLDTLEEEVNMVLDGASEEVLDELFSLCGSSAGARPKVLVHIDKTRQHVSHGMNSALDYSEPWIVKFHNSKDTKDAGAIEYVYALMAKEAGIMMPDVHLFETKKGKGLGYFGVKRFDREGNKRFHMHTACGLLHSDFRTPSLDYEDLMVLTSRLTRDIAEVEKIFRLAVFNVLAHNRDDHAKNFSFLMDEAGVWKFAPAYDLTFSYGPGGEQSTMVMGEGKCPTLKHLLTLGSVASIPKARARDIIDSVKAALTMWKTLAVRHGVEPANIETICKAMSS